MWHSCFAVNFVKFLKIQKYLIYATPPDDCFYFYNADGNLQIS